MQKKTSLLPLAAAVALLFSACTKNDKEPDANQLAALELSAANATSEYAFNDALDQMMSANADNDLARGGDAPVYSRCASVTVSPENPDQFPKTVTLDFGNGCTSPGAVTRQGKIIYLISDRFYNQGASISASFENYKVNGIAVAGSYSITNNGSGGGNGLAISTAISGGSITYPDGSQFNYTGNKTITQTAGMGNLDWSDDEFSISGSSSASNSNGESLTATITENLVKKNSCRNIVQGKSSFTYNGISGQLDYGNGNCDNKAMLTIGVWSKEITLP